MKKLVLAGMIVATSLFAEAPVNNQNQVKHVQHKQIKRHHRINKHNFISLVRSLDLTLVQQKDIKNIVRKNRVRNKNPLVVSIKNSKFDKQLYLKTRRENSEKSIQKRAEVITKIFSILSSAQKTKLDELLHSKRKK